MELENKSQTSGLSKKGQTNNPGGRPKIQEELKAKFKGMTHEVFEFWQTTMRDEDADMKNRIKCSENIMDRAIGKAIQTIEADVESTTRIITIGIPDFINK